jgi:hypothetical protein
VPRAYQIVDVPTTAVLPYGLLTAVEPLDVGASSHWQNGVAWQSRCPTPAVTYDECVAVTGTGAPPAPSSLTDNVDRQMRAATAFTSYLEIDCSPVGAGDLAAYVQEAYGAVEPYAVERALWSGVAENDVVTVFPHLAAASEVLDADGNVLQTVPVTGGPFGPADALGFLEAEMAACLGTIGTIHVPRRALPAFSTMFTANGGRLRTYGGNVIAAGAGYPGTAPNGSAPAASQAWVYGTGQVFGKWGDINVTDDLSALDRANNTRKMIASRTYLMGWNCCHVGVLVDLTKAS